MRGGKVTTVTYYVERPTDAKTDKFLGIDENEFKTIECSDGRTRELFECDAKFINTLTAMMDRSGYKVEMFVNEGPGIRRYYNAARRRGSTIRSNWTAHV